MGDYTSVASATQTLKTAGFFTVDVVKGRGWSDAMIKKYLPPALKSKVHIAPYRFVWLRRWSDRDVAAAENRPEVQAAKQRLANHRASCATTPEQRKATAAKGVEAKRARTAEVAKGLIATIEVRKVPFEEIRTVSISTYAGNYEGECEYPGWSPRTAVNCIRHNYASYDNALYALVGKVSGDAAYQVIKSAVLAKIAEAYPTLAPECDAQQFGYNTRKPGGEEFECPADWDT